MLSTKTFYFKHDSKKRKNGRNKKLSLSLLLEIQHTNPCFSSHRPLKVILQDTPVESVIL